MKIIFYASINKINDQSLIKEINVNCISCKLKDKKGNVYDLTVKCTDIDAILNLDKKTILQITLKSTVDLIANPNNLTIEYLQLNLTLKNKRLNFEKSMIEGSYNYFISRD